MQASELIRTIAIPDAILRTPPGEADLDALATWLLQPGLPETTMTLEEFDGLCCALAVGPRHIAAAEWLPVVFGEDDMPRLRSDEARRQIGMLLRHQRHVATAFAAGTAKSADDALYMPWVLEVEESERITPARIDAEGERSGEWLARWWAAGFNAVLAEWEDEWRPLLEDETVSELAEPFMLLERGYDELDPQGEYDEEGILEQCITAAYAMRRWWDARSATKRPTQKRPAPRRPSRGERH